MLYPEQGITFEDLQPCHGTTQHDSDQSNSNNTKPAYSGVRCKLGFLPKEEWERLARSVIHRAGEDLLYHSLLRYVRKYMPAFNDGPIQRSYALALHVVRSFDNPEWFHYATFNATYRHKALNPEKMAVAMCGNCHEPALDSRQHLFRREEEPHLFSCPHCGSFGPCTVLIPQCQTWEDIEPYLLKDERPDAKP